MIPPDAAPLIRLLSFASPAFPTGGFAYSHGLEWAFERGHITNEATLQSWLHDLLTHGAGRADAILLRHAHGAHANAPLLADIAAFAAASAGGRERQAETLAQGAAFAASSKPWHEVPGYAYPVAFGALAAKCGIDVDAAVLGFLTAWTTNLISAAVRLGPLGQSGGLRVLRALEPHIASVAQETKEAPLEDVGSTCFIADIGAMRHETQYARLFRS